MVRTLDFHSNNVGSIPASLNMLNYKEIKMKKKITKKLSDKKIFKFSLKFNSIYLPSSVSNIKLLNFKKNFWKKNKIKVKQSYILLVWIRYINYLFKGSKTPSIFIFPFNKYKTTVLKAPMAHKTNSQEQFIFKEYTLGITFNLCLNSFTLNETLYYILLIKKIIPNYSTNLLFLRKFTIRLYSLSDKHFSYII